MFLEAKIPKNTEISRIKVGIAVDHRAMYNRAITCANTDLNASSLVFARFISTWKRLVTTGWRCLMRRGTTPQPTKVEILTLTSMRFFENPRFSEWKFWKFRFPPNVSYINPRVFRATCGAVPGPLPSATDIIRAGVVRGVVAD